jgi:hypothetical protein
MTANLNARFVETLGMSPSEVLLGFNVRRRPEIPMDGTWVVNAREEGRKDVINRRLEDVRCGGEPEDGGLRVGGMAWEVVNKDNSSHSKFDPVWGGPVHLEAKASDVSWWVRRMHGRTGLRKVHGNHLKPFIERPERLKH